MSSHRCEFEESVRLFGLPHYMLILLVVPFRVLDMMAEGLQRRHLLVNARHQWCSRVLPQGPDIVGAKYQL